MNLLRMLVARMLVITTEPVKQDLPAKDTAVYVPLDTWVKNANLVRSKSVYHYFQFKVDRPQNMFRNSLQVKCLLFGILLLRY